MLATCTTSNPDLPVVDQWFWVCKEKEQATPFLDLSCFHHWRPSHGHGMLMVWFELGLDSIVVRHIS